MKHDDTIATVLETREIECFLAVATELHFGRAAERLRLSTSQVSQTVRATERHVGAPLFERTSRRVRLTRLGEQLLAGLSPAYARLDQVVREVQQSAAGNRTTLMVGFSMSVPRDVQPAVSAAYAAEHTGSRLVTVPVNPMDMFVWDDHVGGGLDAIVCWLPPGTGRRVTPNLAAGPTIMRSPTVVLMSDSHPFARRASIDVEELADLEVLQPLGTEKLIVPWAPAATPKGRPIHRVRGSQRYVEGLVREIADTRLVHLTIADFEPMLPPTGLVQVPLAGSGPFVCRAVWPTTQATEEVRAFARVAARTGATADWR